MNAPATPAMGRVYFFLVLTTFFWGVIDRLGTVHS